MFIRALINNNSLPVVLFVIVFSLVIYSCRSYPESLNSTFEKAGSNASQLKRVVNYYSKSSKDSLKRKAAIFLIENMDDKYSLKSEAFDRLCVSLDTLFKAKLKLEDRNSKYDSLLEVYAGLPDDSRRVEDLKEIKAAYLIKNIEQAFEAWRSPYAKHLSFDEFCEYLLPYRIGNEKLTNWRDYYKNEFVPKNFKFKKDSLNAYGVCNTIKKYSKVILRWEGSSLPDYDAIFLSRSIRGTCKNLGQLTMYSCRSLGVPVSNDYTPHWACRNSGHEWCALLDETAKVQPFLIGDYGKVGDHLKTNKLWVAPKVFRVTFARQKESLAMVHGSEDIPDEFMSPYMKDVSDLYFSKKDIVVDLKQSPAVPEKKFAYICVFDNSDWVPVHWSKINRQKAVFSRMNTNIVYLPAYYHNQSMVPAGYPVLVKGDSVTRVLKPNMREKQSLVVTRKYNDAYVKRYAESMKGGRFQLSNDWKFKTAIDVYEIQDKPEVCFNTIPVDVNEKYLYFRYIFPKGKQSSVSEIELYSPDSTKSLNGKVFTSLDWNNKYKAKSVFDKKTLTYLEDKSTDTTWVGVKLYAPMQINKIVYLPRNDDNFIRDGEIYELFYWDNKWVSLGRQTGSIKTQALSYCDAPTNALFLLRNLSRGSEERIFTYENDNQVWW